MLAGVGDGSVYQSLDNGQTWIQRIGPGAAAALDVFFDGLGNGFAAIGPTVRFSADNGATWKSASRALPTATIDAIVFDPKNPGLGIAGVAAQGFFKTTTNGQ